MKNIHTPIGQAIVVCDQIITDADTGKKTLVGIFNNISAEEFPVQHPRLCVFVAVTNGIGEYEGVLRLVLEGAHGAIVEAVGNIKMTDPNHVVEMGFEFEGLPFENPGLYSYEFLMDDELILEKRFTITQEKVEGDGV